MQTWRDKYLKRLAVLGYSPTTIESHVSLLKTFLGYLESQGIQEPTYISSAIVRNYQTFIYERLNDRGKVDNVSYRNNLLKVVKRFLKFLLEEGAIKEDPSENVDYAIMPKRLPRNILTEAEMKRLLDIPDRTTALGSRDRTILEVFYSCGIRRAELLNLQLQDVNIDCGVIRINAGKGNKDRVVPIGKMAERYLKHYIKEVRPLLVKDPKNNHVFLSLQGNRITPCMLGLRLKEYTKKAGIDKDISVHTLRATCATHCLRGKKRKQQMHPRHLMELLGHSSMEALNPYLSVSIADLKEAHQRCHPREQDKKAV